MQKDIQTIADSVRSFDKKAFRSGCYAPFVSLYFTTFGDVQACCKNHTFILGNVAEQRILEIWKGYKIAELRGALMDYRFNSGCEFCEWQITTGGYRSAFPSLFESFPVQEKQPEWPGMMEFAISNTCNFQCIMCYGGLSSSIRANREKLPPLKNAYTEQFFQDIREFLPHLKIAKFLGGEPFLAEETLRIWKIMMELGLTIPCHVTTNASIFSSRVERILQNLPISFTVSIDGVTKETFENVRVDSNFEVVMQNVRRFREYAREKETSFSIAYCLMRQNWHEFVDVLLLAEELNCEVFVNTVTDPAFCSLFELPVYEVEQIAGEIEKRGMENHKSIHRNAHVWQESVKNLRNHAESQKISARMLK